MVGEKPKILVMRFSSLGDLVLITPLLKALRMGFPASEIHMACKEMYVEIFTENKNIDRLFILRKGGLKDFLKLHSKLRRERYTVIIDAHNVIRSNLLLHTLRARTKLQIRKDQSRKTLLIERKLNMYERIEPLVTRYMELAGRLGIQRIEEPVTELFVPEPAFAKINEAIIGAGFGGRRLVAIAPGASWETKRWPAGHFESLISGLSTLETGIILLGGSEETALNEGIAVRSSRALLNFTGRLSIIETAAALMKCSVLVTNDSAPLHIAEAVGTPVVALFGPTVEEFGYFPLLEESVALEVQLACRPCSRNGARPCPLGTKECLTAITPEMVIKEVRKILEIEESTTPRSGSGKRI